MKNWILIFVLGVLVLLSYITGFTQGASNAFLFQAQNDIISVICSIEDLKKDRKEKVINRFIFELDENVAVINDLRDKSQFNLKYFFSYKGMFALNSPKKLEQALEKAHITKATDKNSMEYQ